ncbi:MAG: hypothetical protein ACHQYQ_04340 [Bacteriovoracales bacterium]
MKPSHSDETHRILVMLQLDSQRLMERILTRREEYIHRFSLSRSRAHFPDIFDNNYQKMLPPELKLLSEELMVLSDHFYGLVDNLYWYFKQTEDMGVAIEDRLENSLVDIKSSFEKLTFYLKAAIRGEK